MEPLTLLARELLAGPHFAIVATVNADGSPQQSVVWARERDGEVISPPSKAAPNRETCSATTRSTC